MCFNRHLNVFASLKGQTATTLLEQFRICALLSLPIPTIIVADASGRISYILSYLSFAFIFSIVFCMVVKNDKGCEFKNRRIFIGLILLIIFLLSVPFILPFLLVILFSLLGGFLSRYVLATLLFFTYYVFGVAITVVLSYAIGEWSHPQEETPDVW